MGKILDLVRHLTEESTDGAKSGNIAVSKTAVMACLNIASRYIKLQQDFEEYRKESEAKASYLIDKIDATLPLKKEGESV